MAFTRVWQSGAEMQHVNELDELASLGSASTTISSTKAKTGTYSYRYGPSTYPRGKAISGTQFRAGVFLNHSGLAASTSATQAILFHVATSGVSSIYVIWKGDTSDLELYVNGSLVDSVDAASVGFTTTDTWFHVGIACKTDASAGWVSIYLDGVKILDYAGNTGTAANGVYFGGRASTNGWVNYVYFDDFYVDTATSEADAAVPSYRFLWQAVNGAGTSAAWTANGASPNYACVDDAVPNDDTDYVSAVASGTIDYYATASVTVPSGYVIAAIIAAAWAKKTDAGTDSEIKLGTRLSGTDVTGSAQNLPTTYGPLFERQTTKPGGGAWTESDANSAEVKIESAGTF